MLFIPCFFILSAIGKRELTVEKSFDLARIGINNFIRLSSHRSDRHAWLEDPKTLLFLWVTQPRFITISIQEYTARKGQSGINNSSINQTSL